MLAFLVHLSLTCISRGMHLTGRTFTERALRGMYHMGLHLPDIRGLHLMGVHLIGSIL
jgi:hypothetical protein